MSRNKSKMVTMKQTPPYIIIAALFVAVVVRDCQPTKPDYERFELQYDLNQARASYAAIADHHDTIRDTIDRVLIRWRDKPARSEFDRRDSTEEIGMAYKIAFTSCEVALRACDTLQIIQRDVIKYDSTEVVKLRKQVKRERIKGDVKGIVGFVLGFLAGRI